MNKIAIVAVATLAAALTGGMAAGEPSHGPSLVDIMMTTQAHHTKLWLAGNAGNWELADYQADELKEGLEDAAKAIPDYKGVPIGKMIENLVMPPIEEVESAIKARDRAKFAAAYDKLTTACNACHQGSNRAFIVIQRPTASAFPNQAFTGENKTHLLLSQRRRQGVRVAPTRRRRGFCGCGHGQEDAR
jgi:hypothetical protein